MRVCKGVREGVSVSLSIYTPPYPHTPLDPSTPSATPKPSRAPCTPHGHARHARHTDKLLRFYGIL